MKPLKTFFTAFILSLLVLMLSKANALTPIYDVAAHLNAIEISEANAPISPSTACSITPSGPTTICNGGSVTLDAGAGFIYHWSNGSTTQTITATTSGNYCLTVTNLLGSVCFVCQNVSVYPTFQAAIAPGGPTVFCQNSSVTLDAGSGYSAYLWSNGATTQTSTVNTSNTYIVTVTNANGCTATASQTVTVYPFITNLAIVGPTTACAGISANLSTSATYTTYLWSNGATTQTSNIATTGVYYVTVSNAGGCTAVAHRAITILNNPVPVILPVHVCDTVNGTLTVGSVFAAYIWNTGATTQGISHLSSGTYTVTVTSTNGCTNTGTMTIATGCNIPTFPITATTNIAATTAKANWIQPACY